MGESEVGSGIEGEVGVDIPKRLALKSEGKVRCRGLDRAMVVRVARRWKAVVVMRRAEMMITVALLFREQERERDPSSKAMVDER